VRLQEELVLAADLVPEQFSQFQQDLPAEWIEEALYATGTATVRRRRLPAEQVVWLVIGMAMMRDRPVTDVVDKLDLALPSNGRREPMARSAVAQARAKLIRHLGRYDALVEFQVSSEARRKDPTLPKTWQVRAIQYQRKGFQPQILLTSLLDVEAYPTGEIVRLYHERWEIELGYDEIKTEMLDREEAIRSHTVKGVQQELWGIFLAYNLIRLEMERIADEAEVDPMRISFVTSLRYIRDEWFWLCGTRSPGAIPKHLRAMREDIKRFILPLRRQDRVYPRAVKIKMSNYPLNRRRLNGKPAK